MLISEQLNIYSTVSLFVPSFIVILFSYMLYKRKKHPTENVNDEQLFDDWTPEPLVCDDKKNAPTNNYLVEDKPGYTIKLNGIKCINFATHNYLSFVEHPEIEDSSVKCIEKYGIGSCGPRGFYGTIDVHLELEQNIAQFMKAEESVVYSYGFSTSASAITAYVKKKDVVFVDENINFAIQTGLIASRCKVYYFKHNDLTHLELLLLEQEQKDKLSKIESKKFIIVEGIYMKTGQIVPLKEIVELRKKYKLRLFVDESISFGILGESGRGVTEYFNISLDEVDMIIGSLEYALGSIGGFCVGSSFIIEHHVLSGAGYCFSASLAPFLTVAANTALKLIQKDPCLLQKLNTNCNKMHELLLQSKMSANFVVDGHKDSPIKFLYLRQSLSDERQERNLLENIKDFCIQFGFAVAVPSYLDEENNKPKPCIRISSNINHTVTDIERLVDTLLNAYHTFSKSN